MNIALIGYGKMGKAIEEIAIERGHTVNLKISTYNKEELNGDNLAAVDVAIEFTQPGAALENVLACLDAGVPVVCGTTGWNQSLYKAEERCVEVNSSFLQASNFSIGVNVYFEINKQLAALLNNYPDYDVLVEETHHTEKKDAPSGTAITIAEQILESLERKVQWNKGATDIANEIPILSYREENVPGTHIVRYSSPIDDIEIRHIAHNRKGFALGAVLAAEFISSRKGIFQMRDVLFGL